MPKCYGILRVEILLTLVLSILGKIRNADAYLVRILFILVKTKHLHEILGVWYFLKRNFDG